MNKSWRKSKTLWFNAVVSGLVAAEAGMGVLQPVVPVNIYATAVFVLGVGNAVLRFLTSQGIGK
jgi:hypothetical protein